MSIFKQPDFLNSAVLSYGNHQLDLKGQVIPALISGRKFIVDVAIERDGRGKILTEPIEFGPMPACDSK